MPMQFAVCSLCEVSFLFSFQLYALGNIIFKFRLVFDYCSIVTFSSLLIVILVYYILDFYLFATINHSFSHLVSLFLSIVGPSWSDNWWESHKSQLMGVKRRNGFKPGNLINYDIEVKHRTSVWSSLFN